MSVHVSEKTIDSLVRSMKHWDEESKQEFVTRLLATLKPQAAADPSDFFGTWEDDRTADEIIADIYNSRCDSAEREPFE